MIDCIEFIEIKLTLKIDNTVRLQRKKNKLTFDNCGETFYTKNTKMF